MILLFEKAGFLSCFDPLRKPISESERASSHVSETISFGMEQEAEKREKEAPFQPHLSMRSCIRCPVL